MSDYMHSLGTERGKLWCAASAVERVEAQEMERIREWHERERAARQRTESAQEFQERHCGPLMTNRQIARKAAKRLAKKAERAALRLDAKPKSPGVGNYRRALEVATAAEADLVADMLEFNDVERLDPRHSRTLMTIVSYMSFLAERLSPPDKDRKANPLNRWVSTADCGVGKTRALISWCSAMYKLGRDYTVTILTERVEDLEAIHEQLIAKGIPESALGLHHSKTYKPSKVEDVRAGDEKTSKHYCTIPKTADWQSRQILLTTHARLKLDGAKQEGAYYFLDPHTLERRERDLMVWDESLMVAKARTIPLSSLELALKTIEIAAKRRSGLDVAQLDLVAEGVAWLEASIATLQSAAENAKHKDLREVQLTMHPSVGEIFEAVSRTLRRALKTRDERAHGAAARGTLEDLIEFADAPATVWTQEHGADDTLIQFEVVIPENIQRVVVLDASFKLRSLARLPGIGLTAMWPEVSELKRYDSVTLHVAWRADGRRDGESDPVFLDAICDVVENIPADEASLIWTHKDDTSTAQRRLRVHLEDRKVDLEATIAGTTLRDRLVFRTWGRHLSESKYAYTQHAIFASLFFKPRHVLAGEVVGQAADLKFRQTKERFNETYLEEVAADLYQAINRSAMRNVDSLLQARRTDVWLPLAKSHARVLELLRAVMPGVKVVPWLIGDEKGPTKMELAAEEASAYLVVLDFDDRRPASKDALTAACPAVAALSSASRRRLWTTLKERGLISWTTYKELGLPPLAPKPALPATRAPSGMKSACG